MGVCRGLCLVAGTGSCRSVCVFGGPRAQWIWCKGCWSGSQPSCGCGAWASLVEERCTLDATVQPELWIVPGELC